jgi:hypothetical protein
MNTTQLPSFNTLLSNLEHVVSKTLSHCWSSRLAGDLLRCKCCTCDVVVVGSKGNTHLPSVGVLYWIKGRRRRGGWCNESASLQGEGQESTVATPHVLSPCIPSLMVSSTWHRQGIKEDAAVAHDSGAGQIKSYSERAIRL